MGYEGGVRNLDRAKSSANLHEDPALAGGKSQPVRASAGPLTPVIRPP
jgi:hypothetical protein